MFSFGHMDLKGSFFLAWNKANIVNFWKRLVNLSVIEVNRSVNSGTPWRYKQRDIGQDTWKFPCTLPCVSLQGTSKFLRTLTWIVQEGRWKFPCKTHAFFKCSAGFAFHPHYMLFEINFTSWSDSLLKSNFFFRTLTTLNSFLRLIFTITSAFYYIPLFFFYKNKNLIRCMQPP